MQRREEMICIRCGGDCAEKMLNIDFAGEGSIGKVYSGKMTFNLSLKMWVNAERQGVQSHPAKGRAFILISSFLWKQKKIYQMGLSFTEL